MKKFLTFFTSLTLSFVLMAGCVGHQALLWFPVAPIYETLYDTIEHSEYPEISGEIGETEENTEYIAEDEFIIEYIPQISLAPIIYYVSFETMPVGRENPEDTEEAEEDRRPIVALTFDDGPSRYTEQILDLFDTYGGYGTFFVLGHRVYPWRDVVSRMSNSGHEVANHAWSHTNLTRLSREAIAREIRDTSNAIYYVTGQRPVIMRPPFGATNNRVRSVTEDLGYPVINWTVDTMDWRYRRVDHVYNVIMNRVYDGAVILLHDIHGTTAAAMELVIPSLVERGYRLVTTSYLLEYRFGDLEPGRVYGIMQE